MSQNRQPPAFQEYAANILANIHFRLMGIAERGLFYSMRLECWVNERVPSNPYDLSKILGVDPNELKQALTNNVVYFFKDVNGYFSCPELDDYKKYLAEIKKKQSDGGKKSASNRYRSNQRINEPSGGFEDDIHLTKQDSHNSLAKLSIVQQSKKQSIEMGDNSKEWIDDYNRESNGH